MTTASKYTVVNGIVYLVVGILLVVWPGATQTLFMDQALGATTATEEDSKHRLTCYVVRSSSGDVIEYTNKQ